MLSPALALVYGDIKLESPNTSIPYYYEKGKGAKTKAKELTTARLGSRNWYIIRAFVPAIVH
jgi:hypothetical protein